MWCEKQENVMLPGQTCAPQRLQGPHMENKILGPPPGNFDIDFLGGSSRKRKSTAMDQPSAITRETNLQKASMLPGARVEENPQGLCLNTKNMIEPPIFRHQFEKDQFRYQNCSSGSWVTSNGNFHANVTHNLSNDSSRLPSQSLDCKRSFDSLNMQAGECIAGSNWQAQAHNASGPSEAYTSSPFSKSYDAHTGKAQVASHFEEPMSFGIKNHVTDKIQLGMCNTPSETLRPGETWQQNFLKPHRLSVDMGGRTCPQEDNKPGISCDMRQSSHALNNRGMNDVPTVGSASLVSSQNQNHRLLQNEVQCGSSGSLGVRLGEISETEEQGRGDGSVKIAEKTEASDMKNLKHPLSEEFSLKNVSPPSTVEHGQKNDLTRASLRPDEKSKSHFGKATSVAAEKLWEGSLRLSSSVVVSAVAFFKSGEKLLDTNWCESVEVKGKVRLEAFEKYIQDLPRSRNRGLMVISLCWKEGSSETGLTGMKEVAKGYKKTERVGFALLSPGIDLYICPRSEAIITTLAKYGFFKGMAAVEDNQDSMIGCVVWRRYRTSSNAVAKKPENKSNPLSVQPLNSPSDSPIQKAAEKHLSVTQPAAQESLAPASVTATSTIEGAGKNGSESMSINSSKIETEISNSFSGANSLPTASVPSDSTSISVGLQRPAGSNSASLQVPKRDLSEVEAHPTGRSGPEQHKASLELQELPSNIQKETMPSLDDDDLPEFDFTTACGISLTNMSKPSDSVMVDKRIPTEGILKMDRSVAPGTPNVQAMSVSSQRSDHSTRPRLHLTANEGMPPLKIFSERESQLPVFPGMEERPGVQNKVTTPLISAPAFASPKNLFDDDEDDMPEWCPPGLQRLPLAETTRPSTSELPKSNFQNLARGPPQPELPSPLPGATRPSISSQAFPPTFHCPTVRAPPPPPRSLGRGQSSSMGINSNSVLGPPPRFDFNIPFHPPDKRSRRP